MSAHRRTPAPVTHTAGIFPIRASKPSLTLVQEVPSCCLLGWFSKIRHFGATIGQTIPAMQAMQLLASSGVTMAAGAMVSLSFAVSQPLTLPPPRPVPVDASGNVTSQQHRTSETVGAAITDTFARRWQASDDMPLKPVPRRDPLEGLIGGLLTQPLAHDAPQGTQVEQPEHQVTVVPQEPPAPPSDVCAQQGLRRVDYTQNHHRYWRCAHRPLLTESGPR